MGSLPVQQAEHQRRGIRFTLTQSDIRRIEIKGNNDEPLAGKVKVAFGESGLPEVKDVIDGETTIVLQTPDFSEFRVGEWYYASLLPTELTNGFSMKFYKGYDMSQIGEKSFTSSREVKRSMFGSAQNIDQDVEFAIHVFGIELDKHELYLDPMSAEKLTYTIYPEDATDKSVTWKSLDEEIAVVNDGVVTLLKDGETKIVVTTNDGNETDTCTVMGAYTEITEVKYLGNRQKPYDRYDWSLTTFAQYSFNLGKPTSDSRTAQIVINVNKSDADKTTLPTGTFSRDVYGTHAANTFSIKPADGSEISFTKIILPDGTDSEVYDGKVEISKDEKGIYTITCDLLDEKLETWTFEYTGEVENIQDDCIGSQVSTEYYADYNTHFAQAANEWKFNCYFSEAVPGVDELVYQLGFSLYCESGEKIMDQIPEGTYTFAEPGSIEGHPAGVTDAAPGTFSSSQYGGYSDYNAETGNYRYADITGGTITIFNVDVEEHTFNIVYDLNIKTYAYNWETYTEEDVRNYDYQYIYENVKYIPSDSGMRPALDEDQVFTGCMISTKYMSYWYGTDRFGISGTNIFWFYFVYVNNTFNVNIPISTSAEWTWVADVGTKCSTPIPDGTYEFSFVPTANCICNIGTPTSRKGTIFNSYTGSAAYITGGSITFSGNATHVDFNLTATIDGSKDVHYTGGFDTAINYGHTNASAKPITWATTE